MPDGPFLAAVVVRGIAKNGSAPPLFDFLRCSLGWASQGAPIGNIDDLPMMDDSGVERPSKHKLLRV